MRVTVHLFQTVFPTKATARDLALPRDWSDSLMTFKRSICPEETLDGLFELGVMLVLSLSNSGRIDLSELTVEITGNATSSGKPSSLFDAGVTPVPRYPPKYTWH